MNRLAALFVVVVFLVGFPVGADEWLECASIPLPQIEWLACTDEDDDEDDPAKEAHVIRGVDEQGAYYGAAWTSTGPVDFDLNGLHRFHREGTEAFELVLSASASIDVGLWIGVGGEDNCCGRNTRYVVCHDTLSVGTHPSSFTVRYSSFSEDPYGPCDEPLGPKALEEMFSIILWPEAPQGELRIYGVGLCSNRVDDLVSAHQEEAAAWTGPVIDNFTDGDGTSLGGTAWMLDRNADIERASDGMMALHLVNPGSGVAEAELALDGFDLSRFDGLYVVAHGTLWGQLVCTMEVEGPEGMDSLEGAAMFLNEPIREFRFPFSGQIDRATQKGSALQLSLLSTYGAAEATVVEVGFYDRQMEMHPLAEAVVWITPLPPTDPSVVSAAAELTPTDALTLVGNPFTLRFPNRSGWENARSVWDMQHWEERIYLAHGDMHSNAGPTDVWYFDLSRGAFIKEGTIDEEGIRRFAPSGSTLFIPGGDAREPNSPREWELGNIYRLAEDGWQKQRTVPWAYHVWDVLQAGDELLVCGDGSQAWAEGGDGPYAFIHVSKDDGETWRLEYPSSCNKIERLFSVAGSVYASAAYPSGVLEGTERGFAWLDIDPFPNVPEFTERQIAESNAPNLPPEWQGRPRALVRINRLELWQDGVLYIGSFPGTEDPIASNTPRSFPDSVGIFHATNIGAGAIERLQFIPDGLIPIDLVVCETAAYVLAISGDPTSNHAAVFRGDVSGVWHLIFSTDMLPAKAYSFEIADGYVYLGLGGPNEFSGNVYRASLPDE